MMDWYGVKTLVVEQTGLSRDLLHILVGLFGQVLVAALIRRSLASPLPWLAVLIAEIANEYHDISSEAWMPTHIPIWPDSLRDLLVTMAAPTALLLLTRYAPGLFTRPEPPGTDHRDTG
jgi:hypothetical protein